MKRILWPLPLFLLAACGGGLPHSSSVVVSVTPAQTTVKTGGSVVLTGDATGFTATPIVSWWIQESKDNDFNNDCGKLDTQSKDFTGCPYGFVMYNAQNALPTSATFYAAKTPGTYHVTVSMTQACCWFDYLTKTAQAIVIVTN